MEPNKPLFEYFTPELRAQAAAFDAEMKKRYEAWRDSRDLAEMQRIADAITKSHEQEATVTVQIETLSELRRAERWLSSIDAQCQRWNHPRWSWYLADGPRLLFTVDLLYVGNPDDLIEAPEEPATARVKNPDSPDWLDRKLTEPRGAR